ncbi:insulinase family protein [Sphingosinithalassobacter tenebrarum]|uniref:Insulinase family protein n=2 Tax=Stakelama tenebrarum TaxID=2711215 RepID=A0A6G6YAP9_9SPHN|nr:insulinase family protein [Sphingosinithalassobacter tenebrarum]
MRCILRISRFALLLLVAAPFPALAQQAPATAAATDQDRDNTPWLYRDSDVPVDPAWRFGTLPNGVRYAVRKNGVPPGQVSIRVRIDAGSLMEGDAERGYAHLLEHLSFRGSAHVPDGESKRIWQRLGVTFGSDSNAATTFTHTVYQLDLPNAGRAGLDESMHILSGMMAAPTITQTALDAERPVVLAEQREQPGPQVRMQDALLSLMFAGQPLAQRDPIGTVETLTAATPESVKAFHDRWYRPERAVVVLVGDMDPALLEEMVVKHFSGWQGVGPAPETPDFGAPEPGHPVSAAIVEPAMQRLVTMAVMRPWTVFQDTVIFNQERMVDLIAIRILNRRMETRARTGASFIAAGASLDDVARSANVTTIRLLPVGDDWEAALGDVRAIIADAIAHPPTQDEIDREVAEIDAAMRNAIASEPVEAAAIQADDMVHAVDINETTTNAEGSYSIFRGAVDAGMFTPEAVQAASARVFQGTATRALVNVHASDPEVVGELAEAITAQPAAQARRENVADVSFDDLQPLGEPGSVVSRETVVAQPEIEQVNFDNGVRLIVHSNPSEVSRVYVRVRFGGGLGALPADRQTPAWAGDLALVASGIGPFGQEELDTVTGQRQIGLDFAIADDAFVLGGQTTAEDLDDQLLLLAQKLQNPSWDPNPVNRARAVMLAGYSARNASADAVLSSQLDRLLRAGDPRWGVPSRETIAALTPEAFRAFWEPILKSGPIEVSVFGDVDREAAVQAVARTFGALPPRPAAANDGAPVRFAAHDAEPVVRRHEGQPDQAAAVIAWPTGGGSDGIAESRKLEILAAVFRDRFIDRLRSQAGISYSPTVISRWPVGANAGGGVLALALVPPDKTDLFFQVARDIAADLAANPIGQDELRRAVVPLGQTILRRSTGNNFWMDLVEGASRDPARYAAVPDLADDYVGTTAQDLQALAAKYFDPARDWTLEVLPSAQAQGAAPAAAAAQGR